MTGPAIGTVIPGADPIIAQDRLAVLIGSHWDESQGVVIVGVRDTQDNDVDVTFLASRATNYVVSHVQKESTGGVNYNSSTSVSSTRIDCRQNRLQTVTVTRTDGEAYYIWLVPEFVEGDGTFTKFDGVDGADRMAYRYLGGGDLWVGAIQSTGRLHVGNDAARDFEFVQIGGTFTSGGAGAVAAGADFDVELQAATGDTTLLTQVIVSGAITTQGASETVALVTGLYVSDPVITVGSGDSVTAAASLYVSAAPTEASSNYAMWIDAGAVRIDQGVALGGGSTATLGTIGGSGPATAAQNEWIQIETQNGTRWIPAWA